MQSSLPMVTTLCHLYAFSFHFLFRILPRYPCPRSHSMLMYETQKDTCRQRPG
jgi:hypothetical protein